MIYTKDHYEKLSRVRRSKYYREFLDTLYSEIRPAGGHYWELVVDNVQEFILDIIKDLDPVNTDEPASWRGEIG